MQRFTAIVYKVGINPCVDVPERVSKALDKCGHIPVLMELKRLNFCATLVPIGNGRHRLYINGEIRRKANVKVGDRVNITLRLDAKPRIPPYAKMVRRCFAEKRTSESSL